MKFEFPSHSQFSILSKYISACVCVDCFCIFNIIPYLCNQNSFWEFYYSNHTRFDFESFCCLKFTRGEADCAKQMLNWKMSFQSEKRSKERIWGLTRSFLGDVGLLSTILSRLLLLQFSVFFASRLCHSSNRTKILTHRQPSSHRRQKLFC